MSRTSKISNDDIINNLFKSTSMKDLIEILKGSVGGASYRSLNKRILELELNTDHWKIYRKEVLTNIAFQNEIPLETYLVNGSNIFSNSLKKKLLKYNLLKNECNICGQQPFWNGAPLTLQLDHINGIRNDNRIENLRILCPHCHSQTDTYAGKNNRVMIKCFTCANKYYKIKNKYCDECYEQFLHRPQTRIDWPSTIDLLQMLKESNFVQVGKILGVSDNAIRKHLKGKMEQVGVVETPS